MLKHGRQNKNGHCNDKTHPESFSKAFHRMAFVRTVMLLMRCAVLFVAVRQVCWFAGRGPRRIVCAVMVCGVVIMVHRHVPRHESVFGVEVYILTGEHQNLE